MGMFEQLRATATTVAPPPEPVSLTGEEAINKMDHVFALVVAINVRKDNGLPPLEMTRKYLTDALAEGKRGAQVAHLLERGGTPAVRVFSETHWKPLIEITDLGTAKRFCSSQYMNPSVCIRIISSLSSIDT